MPHAGELIPFGMLGSGVQQFLARPSSANLASAVTDETGSGALVFATSPTINNPFVGGNAFINQGAPFSLAASATLTRTQLRTKIIQYTGADAANLTTPTGTELDGSGALPNNYGWDFSIINTGSATATLTAGVDVTLVGTMAVTAGTSGAFRTRKTATNTFTIYRMA